MVECTSDPMLVALLHRTIESLVLPPTLEGAVERYKQAARSNDGERSFEWSDEDFPASTPDSEKADVLWASSEASCPESPKDCECSSHRRQRRKTPLEELCTLLVKSISLGLTEGTAALLLLLCPNLERLDMTPPDAFRWTAVGKATDLGCGAPLAEHSRFPNAVKPGGNALVNEHRNGIAQDLFGAPWPSPQALPISSFSCLRELKLNCVEEDRGYFRTPGRFTSRVHLSTMNSLLNLPTLQSFTATAIMDDPIVSCSNPELKVLSLKHIRLQGRFLGSKSIARLLAACSRLETLSVSWDDPGRAYDERTTAVVEQLYAFFNWSHIAEALAKHKDSLETLSLFTSGLRHEYVQGEHNSTKDSGLWQCLGGMTRLRSLFCNASFAHGSKTTTGEPLTSVVPKSVEDLQISEDLNIDRRVHSYEEATSMRLESPKQLLADRSFTRLKRVSASSYKPVDGQYASRKGWRIEPHDFGLGQVFTRSTEQE